MGIASERPTSGLRVRLERTAQNTTAPFVYEGTVDLPERSFAVSATVDASGQTSVTVEPGAPDDAAERVRLLLRTAFRQSESEGGCPARKIVRWRGEK